jgi:hypothetical protein
MKLNLWQQSLSALTIASLVAPLAIPAALAQSGSLTGQTRCAKQSTVIFSQRSAASPALRLVTENQQVTLDENTAENGFIAVSNPVRGFIQTVTLTLCPNSGTTPGSSSTCRRVTVPQGLIVRQGASPSSTFVGNVAGNSQVFLTTNPATASTGPDGRIWVKIAQPLAGWVSNGFQNVPGSNLVNCQ